MGWPYSFATHTDEYKEHRREVLDKFGLYAQLSALIPIVLFQSYRLLQWLRISARSRADYQPLPTSSTVISQVSVAPRKWHQRARLLVWYMSTNVRPHWGCRGHWIVGILWFGWLIFLCVFQTGDGMFCILYSHIIVKTFMNIYSRQAWTDSHRLLSFIEKIWNRWRIPVALALYAFHEIESISIITAPPTFSRAIKCLASCFCPHLVFDDCRTRKPVHELLSSDSLSFIAALTAY